MKILLDECVDRRLGKDIVGHEIKTVPQMGWAGIKNGDLLTLAEKEFEVFVTVDRNLSFQQNLSLYKIAVVILRARTNRLRDLRALVPRLMTSLSAVKRGEALWVDAGEYRKTGPERTLAIFLAADLFSNHRKEFPRHDAPMVCSPTRSPACALLLHRCRSSCSKESVPMRMSRCGFRLQMPIQPSISH